MPENLPPDVEKSVAAARAFIEQSLQPLELRLPAPPAEPPPELRRQVREASRRAGFFGKTQPADFGGDPAGPLELAALRETFAAADLRLADFVFGPGPGILAAAGRKLQADYLAPVLAGEKRGAFGFTEPEDAARPTWAVLEAGRLRITGRKSFVTGGATADFVTLLVNLEDPHGEKLGTALVLVDREAPGVVIEREFQSLEGGIHAAMRFTEVEVPEAHIIGKPGEGMPRALSSLGELRLSLAANATGKCLAMLRLVRTHLAAPHRSGAPLSAREGVRLRFAELWMQIYAARACLYRTARLVASGQDAAAEVMAAKVFCTETAGRVADTAVQLVGGGALIAGHPLERAYRAVRSMRLAEGASDLLRLKLAESSFAHPERQP